jgi:hypothetical protein
MAVGTQRPAGSVVVLVEDSVQPRLKRIALWQWQWQ